MIYDARMPNVKPSQRNIGILIGIVAVLLPFAVFALPKITGFRVTSYVSEYISSPFITWSENPVSTSLFRGQNVSRNVTFFSSNALSRVTLRVTPEISRFLSKGPTVNTDVPADDPQTLRLDFVVPIDTEPGTYTGSIEVMANNRPIRIPLEVSLYVGERIYSNKDLGITFEYPPITQPLDVVVSEQFVEIRLQDGATNQFNPIIGFSIHNNAK